MKKSCLSSVCAVLMMGVVLAAAPLTASAEVGISVGDYWNYVYDDSFQNMSIEGEMRMRVADRVSSGGLDLFVVQLTSSTSVSGSFGDVAVSGEVTVSGVENRLTSNFSLVSRAVMLDMSMADTDFSFTVKMGVETSVTPPQDDYIGDDAPAAGVTVVSRSSFVMVSWLNMMGMNESYTEAEDVTTTMEVVQEGVSVTTPAGTFECYKVMVGLDKGDDVSTLTYYYSDKVGFYVKMEGEELLGSVFTSLELESYSYGEKGRGLLAMFIGENWWVAALIVAAVVVFVLTMSRWRRRLPEPMPPQPQPTYPEPLPPDYPPPPPDEAPGSPPPGSG